MNSKQRIVLIFAALLVGVTGVWVPWKAQAHGENVQGDRLRIERPCGYWWAFSQPAIDARLLFPDVRLASIEARIDTSRIYLQWTGIVLIAALLAVALHDRGIPSDDY